MAAACLNLVLLIGPMLATSYFFSWRASGVAVIGVVVVVLTMGEHSVGSTRRLLLQDVAAADKIKALSGRSYVYVWAQVAWLLICLTREVRSSNAYLTHEVTAHFDAILEAGEAPALCDPTANNESFVISMCPKPRAYRPIVIDSLGRESSVIDSGCVDGAFGVYPSMMDACLASRLMEQQVAEHQSFSLLAAITFFLFLQDTWEMVLDDHLSLKTRRISKCALVLIQQVCYLSCAMVFFNCLGGAQRSIITRLIARNIFNGIAGALIIAQGFINVWPLVVVLGKKLVHDVVHDSKDEQYDVFLSHHWGDDQEGRNNHDRVRAIANGLRARGIKVWLDENIMDHDLTNQMSDGIDSSRLVAVFITKTYIRKVQGLGPLGLDDNCKGEFEYALRRHGVAKILPVVMEAGCLDTNKWTGGVGFRLGSKLYTDLSKGLMPSDDQLDAFATSIQKCLGSIVERSTPRGRFSALSRRVSGISRRASGSSSSLKTASGSKTQGSSSP
jgi:hypothetical protein